MPRGTLVIALLTASCGESIVAFELPPLEGARSAIFAFHGPDSAFQAMAVDLEGDVVVSFPVALDPGAEGTIEALGFAKTLAELGLSAGRIEILPEGNPLDAEDELFVASFRGTEAGEWVKGSERSEEVEQIRLPIKKECTKLEVVDSFILDSRADHVFTLSLGTERALVAQADAKLYVVTPSGPEEVTDLAIEPPLTDYVMLGDGSLLFSGTLGRVFTGRITTSTSGSPIRIEGEVLTILPAPDRIMKIAGGREGGALELFALTEPGIFYRYDGVSWEELHRFGVELSTASEVIRARPGLAYAATDEKAEIVRYRDGILGPFSPPDLLNGVPGMKILEPFGLVASRSEGGIYRLVDMADWELIEGSPISLNVYSFYSLGSSFLFAGAFGLVSEWRPDDGYCPPIQLGGGAIREITRFGEGFVFGEDKPMSRDQVQVTLVRFAD